MESEANSTMKIEKDMKLNIMVVGDIIEEQYLQKVYASEPKILETPLTECKKRFTLRQDETLKWTYEIFEKGLSKDDCGELLKRIKDHNPKYNVIICFIHKDIQNAKNLIAVFDNEPLPSHPFIIFVSQDKSVNKNAIKKYIEEEEITFDIRNLRFIDYDGTSELNFMPYLWEFCCYYNELGQGLKIPDLKNLTTEKIFKAFGLNFFLFGKPGRGKSTFINILNNRKLAKESTGKPVTTIINKYSIKDYNINLFDCPGFATGEKDNPELLKKKVGEYYKNLKYNRDNIHGVLYLFNATDTRNYDDGEKNVIRFILDLEKENKIDMYFLINFASNCSKGKKKKQTQNFITQLKSDLKNDFGDEIKNLDERIFPINIINTSETDEGNCFGLDKLFEYLYKQFSPKIVEKSELNKLKSLEEINKFIEKNELYKGKTNKEELLQSIKSKCNIEIASFCVAAGAIGAIPIPFADIAPLYGLQISMIIAIALTFGISIDKNTAKQHLKSLAASVGVGAAAGLVGKVAASSLKLIPGVGTVIGGVINASIASSSTAAIGKAAVDMYTRQMTDENLLSTIKEIVVSYNNAINGFNELQKNFENKKDYSDLD